MKRIAILDDYQNVALTSAPWDALDGRAEVVVFNDHLAMGDALVERLNGFDILVLNRERTPMPAALLEALPRLKLIVTSGMRNAAIDTATAAARGITVCGTRTLGPPTAELTWALILALFRHLPTETQAIARGGWQTTLGRDLHGKTLGIAGPGRIGSAVARVGGAFGMRVLAWSRSLTPARAQDCGVESVTRDELLRHADVLTLHLPLTAETRAIVGARELSMMKRDAVLVNTARGALVDEAALVDALRSGRIGGAAIDTFEQEPVPPDHPLTAFDNVILTPHLGYVTEDNYRLAFGEALDDVLAWLNGEPVRVIAGPGTGQSTRGESA